VHAGLRRLEDHHRAYNVAMRARPEARQGDKVNIRAANGERMPCEGAVTVNASLGKRTVALRALVSSALKDEILLGWQEMVALGILTKTFPVPGQRRDARRTRDAKAIADEFPEVFEEDTIKPMKGKPMRICLAGDVKPTRVLTARQVPVHLQQAAQETLGR
jgi:hypothetical protein